MQCLMGILKWMDLEGEKMKEEEDIEDQRREPWKDTISRLCYMSFMVRPDSVCSA